MVRGIVKKGLIGAGLAAGAMFLLFGAKAWHYTRYAAEKVRQNVQSAVPFEADAQAAREQVKALEPAIKDGVEALVKLEASIKGVKGEITALNGQLDGTGKAIERLRASLDQPGVQRVSSSDPSVKKTNSKLANAIDTYKRAKYVLDVRQDELVSRTDQYRRLYDYVSQLGDKKRELMARIESLEAQHEAMKVKAEYNDFQIDTSPLAQAERAVAELDSRVERDIRTGELRAQFAGEAAAAPDLDTDRDLRRESDEILGRMNGTGRTADKEL